MWVIKENKKPGITSVNCTLYICNKVSIRMPLVVISHFQLFWFPFNVSCKQNINLTKVFHVKPSFLAFSFSPPVSFEIFTAGFSSLTFIFPSIRWLKKSDYSSLDFCELVSPCKKSVIASVYCSDTVNFWVPSPDWLHPLLTMPNPPNFAAFLPACTKSVNSTCSLLRFSPF